MNTLLTDRLCCPRCGPRFGLVLLAREVVDRRVLEGTFGCANCRDAFPVRSGFADLRAPPRGPVPQGEPELNEPLLSREDRRPSPSMPSSDASAAARAEGPWRLAALLDVARGSAVVLLAGQVGRCAPGLADLLDEVEVVAVGTELVEAGERRGVSRMLTRPGLPFRDATLRGVALSGRAAVDFVGETARTVAPGGRVVLLDASGEARERARNAGLETVLEERSIFVAARPGPRSSSGGRELPVV